MLRGGGTTGYRVRSTVLARIAVTSMLTCIAVGRLCGYGARRLGRTPGARRNRPQALPAVTGFRRLLEH